MTARIFLIECLCRAKVWERNVIREIFASRRQWSISVRVWLQEGEPLQRRFAADGHSGKTLNNPVSRAVNTALTKYSSALIHRRGRRGTQRESGLLSPLRTSATSAVEPKIDNFVNAVLRPSSNKFVDYVSGDIGKSEITAAVMIREPGVVNAKQVENGHVQG